MNIYIALLRGINVSGQKMIKMIELKSMFESLGFDRVQTYIQSGNVLFEAEEEWDTLRRRIENEIQVVFGFQVTVVLRKLLEMKRIIRHSPFDAETIQEGESLHITLLADQASPEGIDRLLACGSDIDEYRMLDQEVYILCRKGYQKTVFSNNFLEKKLKVPATTRNWRTINILVDMGKVMEAQ